jgi:putative endonuclease
MHIVYILISKKYPARYYIGITQDLDKRLKEHNSGDSMYTKKYAPWQIETFITLRNRRKAQELETYLKSGSGFAFLKKRLI